YSDLFDAVKLKELAEKFYAEVREKQPVTGEALDKYIASHGFGIERRVESQILTDAAPLLSDFVARLFRVSAEKEEMERAILEQNPIWKYKFFVQRRAAKTYKPDQAAALDRATLTMAVTELRNNAF